MALKSFTLCILVIVSSFEQKDMNRHFHFEFRARTVSHDVISCREMFERYMYKFAVK